MGYRFAEFVLDEGTRELRVGDREIVVQPRVFDLLVYLIEHHDRVVSKDELLESLWPGTVVVDSALHRVVSLARSALAEGGARDAIRTYARHGYRFCADVEARKEVSEAADASATLERARRAFASRSWAEALRAFGESDRREALQAHDLERWAQAAQWEGDAARAIGPLERAVAAHLASGDRRGGARAALLLSQIQFERLDLPVAKGWLKRAQKLLDDNTACRELGLAHYTAARLALVEGPLDASLAHADRARALGLELGDPDIEALGLAYRGHALLSLGHIEAGVETLDEAAAAALAGEMSPWAVSLVYCSVIWACRNRGDWDRASQWTEQFTRWCERSGLTAFPGTCRLHRAEVLGIRGELAEAEKEINEAKALLATWAPWAEGDAYRVLGDLRLSLGDVVGAELAFRRAHELGWDPQPGYAMLRLASGDPDAALRGLESALLDASWANRERRGLLLANLAIAAALAGCAERARGALAELEENPQLWSATAIEAVVMRARAEVASIEGRIEPACAALRDAANIWRRIGSPLNVAITQQRLGDLLIASGDTSAAELELGSAEAAFRKLALRELAEQCAARRNSH